MQKRYPFKFLDSYTREDKDIFFGRDEEVKALYEMIFQTDLLLVQGPSGVGKTSLIKCGLAGKFESHDWLALDIRRGSDLNESLFQALQKAGGTDQEAGETDPLDWLDEDFSEPGPSGTETQAASPLARLLKSVYRKHFKPVYLIFDQFEELYTIGNKAEQDAFVENVQEILRVKLPVKIILSIREEYLGHLYDFERKLPELQRKKLRVEPMHLDKVKEVVLGVGALKNGNVRLKSGEEQAIAAGIFEKIKEKEKTLSIELPYLQVFLDKLYMSITGDEKRQAEATFSLEALDSLGNIGDVLRDFLDEQVMQIASRLDQKPETIWQMLSPFVTLEGTKEPLTEAELGRRLEKFDPVLVHDVLEAFSKGRILRFSEQELRYEVKHDSLAKRIHAKRSDDDIAVLEVQRLVKNQLAPKAEARELFSEKQLGFIEPLLPKLALLDEEKEWIEKSRARVESEKAEAERLQAEALEKAQAEAERERHLRDEAETARKESESAKRRATWFAWGAGALAVAGVFLAVFAWNQSQAANREKVKAEKSAQEARAARDIAEAQRLIADSSAVVAQEKTVLAEQKTQEAEASLSKAQKEEKRALSALGQVQKEKDLTEAQRAVAERALSDIRSRNLVTFREFTNLGVRLIYTLDHEEALEKLKVSCGIDVDIAEKRRALVGPLQELLYFYGESCRRPELAVTAARLLRDLGDDKMPLGELERCVAGQWVSREQFGALLSSLPDYGLLKERYYPVMVEVPTGVDGEFEMGSEVSDWGHQKDETVHKVRLQAYQIGATEVTFYQYALFGEATGRGLRSRTPYWGRNGNHPVVNVNWYEALEYANWLNVQLGYDPMYELLKEVGSDPDNGVSQDFLKWKVTWSFGKRGYRLPTEAEWELAARAGTRSPRQIFSGGDDIEE